MPVRVQTWTRAPPAAAWLWTSLSSVERLKLSRVAQAFLKSKDANRRLDHLEDQLQRGGKQIPPEQQAEVGEWLREQRGEVSTFRSHCHNRQQQMESLLSDLSRCHRAESPLDGEDPDYLSD